MSCTEMQSNIRKRPNGALFEKIPSRHAPLKNVREAAANRPMSLAHAQSRPDRLFVAAILRS